MTLGRIREIVRKEFIQLLRDPRMKGIVFVIPVIQVLVFGYAVSTDVRNVPTAVQDHDNSVTSRDFISRFTGSGYFDVVAHVADDKEARRLIDRGDAQVLLSVNKGFGADLRAGRGATAQIIVDGSDSNTAQIALDYGGQIASRFSKEILLERALRQQGRSIAIGGVEIVPRAWFNENLESRNFYVPGVIAIMVMLITLMLTSMAVVREKEIGTMEQIMVTPITSAEFILGKTIPFALIGFIDVLLVTLVGLLWFHVPIRGSLLLLFGATGLYLMSTLGIGLLISTVSQTQQQAMMGTFFIFLPAVLLSGFLFPIANMPEVIQWATYLNPLRYFLIVVRGIFLKGIGPAVLWPQMVALAAMGLSVFTLATLRFRKTLA